MFGRKWHIRPRMPAKFVRDPPLRRIIRKFAKQR